MTPGASLTIARIAAALGTQALGDANLRVRGLAEPASARLDDLALAMTRAFAEQLGQGQARAAVVAAGTDWRALGLQAAIEVGRPRLAMAELTRAFDSGPDWAPGIHPAALVDPAARIGVNVTVGAFTLIGPEAVIGDGTRIGSHVSIAAGARIGAGALIHPGVRIGPRVSIGANFIAHPNAVVGADGFSFVTAEISAVEKARRTLGDTSGTTPQPWERIHSLGGVVIGNDVELGASSAIDYGTVRATRIGDGTKIDNLVHIAHNVVVGRHCLLCALVGIAGSSVIGDFVVLGGQAGVADNVSVGDRVIAGGGTKILSNVPGGQVVQGYPAVRMETHVASYKALRRLPRILEHLRAGGRGKAGEIAQNVVSKPHESE